MAKFRVLGRPLPREDGLGKVTGQAHFTADVVRPGTLWGKILRSPLPHARIVNVDANRAKRLAGVKAVITAADVSSKLTSRTLSDLPVLARDRVRFVGNKVAAVDTSSQSAIPNPCNIPPSICPPAVGNAVHNATGARLMSLPLSAEKVHEALKVLTPHRTSAARSTDHAGTKSER